MSGSRTLAPGSTEQSLSQAKLARVVELLDSRSAVADALGVHRSRITRWLAGDQLDPENRAKLDGLEYILSRLLDHMSQTTARKWLEGINAHLGNRRPVDLIASQRVAEVVAAVEQSAVDSFA
jgi:uncharacterized protein (DUF2384 family)